jgi:hypothetical protein
VEGLLFVALAPESSTREYAQTLVRIRQMTESVSPVA